MPTLQSLVFLPGKTRKSIFGHIPSASNFHRIIESVLERLCKCLYPHFIRLGPLNPTWRCLGPGAVFTHSLHVLTSFEASQKQMLQLDLTMLNFGNSGINYPNLLLTHDYFFKQVENILLICVDFSNNMVLLLSTRFCQCDFLQTMWLNFRWCYTRCFPHLNS